MRPLMIVLSMVLLPFRPSAQVPTEKTLDIYFIDVEGGHAVLYVSPSGQSMLVDTGYGGFNGRDADRIVAAATRAGLKQIDYLVITHYHGDHAGGTPQLAARLPIRNFVDDGAGPERTDAVFQAYAQARAKGNHIGVKPGDRIPVAGLTVQVLSAGGGLLTIPVEGGGGPNPLCATFVPMKDDVGDDARSVGTLITYGKFRTINLGDLSWNQEYGLVCPTNRIGTIDVLLASQHGDDEGGSAAYVHALRPKVGITNNGPKKAVVQPIIQTMRSSPGFQDAWQLHQSFLGNQQNVPDQFIANLGEVDAGHWLKVSARADGSFTVTNDHDGYTKSYAAGN